MQNIQDRVIQAISEQIGMLGTAVKPESKFIADLGCDSLDSIEITMALEDEFDLVIDDEHADKWESVQDAINYVTEAVKSNV
jgi:acyl carrier protein